HDVRGDFPGPKNIDRIAERRDKRSEIKIQEVEGVDRPENDSTIRAAVTARYIPLRDLPTCDDFRSWRIGLEVNGDLTRVHAHETEPRVSRLRNRHRLLA